MRTTNRTVDKLTTITVTEVGITEEFIYRQDFPLQKLYMTRTRLLNDNNEMVEEQDINITGDDYDLLMSQSPEFSPGKVAGDCREEDVWYMVDLIRSR